MLEHIGSQIREPIEDTEYKISFRDEHLVLGAKGVRRLEYGPDVVLLNTQTGISELWREKDDYAGYVIVIDGKGFEFIQSLD